MEQQLYLGRCVVVLKRSCGDLADLEQDEILDFVGVVKELENLPKEELENHIVILGAGVFGNSIAAVLRNYGTVVTVDHNPSNILANIKKKLYSIYGSAESPEVWKKANYEKAKLVISTMPDTSSAISLIQKIKKAKTRLFS